MRDLSFFFLKKYSLASRMRRRGPSGSGGGFASSCGGNGSTSTLNQTHKIENTPKAGSPKTLEEMILQLEMEEDTVRRAKLRECYFGSYDDNNNDADKLYDHQPARMSCVNSSDILRSARNALNQYPRFSLDGKDAMYRSSFQCQLEGGADLVRKTRGRRSSKKNVEIMRSLPQSVGGESVVWCEAGLVAKLMGLEMIPVPVKGKTGKEKLGTLLKRERLKRRDRNVDLSSQAEASCSAGGFSVMRQVGTTGSPRRVGGWPTLRFQ